MPAAPFTLQVAWVDGGECIVSLLDWITQHQGITPFDEPSFFAKAHVGEDGWTVAWIDDEIEIDSIHLQLLEAEQQGLILHPEAFWRWRNRHGFTAEEAARVLGLTMDDLLSVEQGTSFMPWHIVLAIKGFDALHSERQAA